jgi:hypothetical protein
LTSKRIRRGVFGSVTDLKAAIDEFLAVWNENPRPFIWTATVGFHRRETLALPANSGADSTRMHSPAIQEKEEEMNGPAIYWTPL